tara:strand:- start:1432 stop:1878 length:447 start_codon:yes stop_codon:yes gene_type:complete
MISNVQDEPLFKSKSFLQQKYLSESLSASQIAREISSARSTVSAHLNDFEIEPKDSVNRNSKGQLGFGERLVKGQVVPHKGELAVIEEMLSMRSDGASFGKIVDWLNQNNVRTKNRVRKWDRPTVYKIINRFSGRSLDSAKGVNWTAS